MKKQSIKVPTLSSKKANIKTLYLDLEYILLLMIANLIIRTFGRTKKQNRKIHLYYYFEKHIRIQFHII